MRINHNKQPRFSSSYHYCSKRDHSVLGYQNAQTPNHKIGFITNSDLYVFYIFVFIDACLVQDHLLIEGNLFPFQLVVYLFDKNQSLIKLLILTYACDATIISRDEGI